MGPAIRAALARLLAVEPVRLHGRGLRRGRYPRAALPGRL